MHTKQKRLALGVQRLGGGDIGKDHAFFDQAMRIKARFDLDTIDCAGIRENNFALGQIEVKRLPPVPRGFQRGIGGIERLDHILNKGGRALGNGTIHRRLHLFVMQRGGRLHQTAHKGMVDFLALCINHHAHRDTGPRHPFVQ